MAESETVDYPEEKEIPESLKSEKTEETTETEIKLETIEDLYAITTLAQEGNSTAQEFLINLVTSLQESGFMVESIQDIYEIMTIARGGNPQAQQTLTDFLKMDNNLERAHLPNNRAVVAMAQLDGFAAVYYPYQPRNPFTIIKNAYAVATMGKHGNKSKQFVELMRNTVDLSKLETTKEDVQRSFRDRVLGG